jgi:hypothetical protein
MSYFKRIPYFETKEVINEIKGKRYFFDSLLLQYIIVGNHKMIYVIEVGILPLKTDI